MISHWEELEMKPLVKNIVLKSYLERAGDIQESFWLFYHFQNAHELFDSGGGNMSRADASLKYIWDYYTQKPMDTALRLKLAKYFVLFNWLDKAKQLIEQSALATVTDHESLALYLKLHYLHLREGSSSDYFDLLMRSSEILTTSEWCHLFKGSCNLSFQIFDYEPVRSLYCKQCAEADEVGVGR
jgi:hypothetical protein